MTRKKIGRNQGDSGRLHLSGSELEQFGVNVGDEVKVNIAESRSIAHAMIDNVSKDDFIIISPASQLGESEESP